MSDYVIGDPWNPQEIADRFELLLLRGLYRWERRHPALFWYTREKRWIHGLAKEYGFDPVAVAQAVAVLSPQVSWLSQKLYVPKFLKDVAAGGDGSNKTHPGFLRNRQRAAELLFEENALKRARMVRGPKVRAFALALQGKFSGHVVIDTHMVDAGLGISAVENRKDFGTLTLNRYRMLSDALLVARARVCPEVCPHSAQALVWEEQRRKRGLA